MADIITARKAPRPEHGSDDAALPSRPAWHLIELLFFAYRDFVGDVDEILAGLGFGRAHHRVLHFVNRNPGITVAELLDVLRITKQSLARVLKQLVDDGFIMQREGPSDRRQRLLHATEKGEALALKFAGLQTARIDRALAGHLPQAREIATAFLTKMIDDENREQVLRRIAHADRAMARIERQRAAE